MKIKSAPPQVKSAELEWKLAVYAFDSQPEAPLELNSQMGHHYSFTIQILRPKKS